MEKNAKTGKKIARFNKRKYRYGGLATLITVGVIAVVIVLNVVVGLAEDNWALKIDLSANRVTDFEQETYDLIGGLDQEVHVYTVYQDATSDDVRVQMDEIINKMRALANGKIVVDNIDPVKNPTTVSKYAGENANLSEGAIILTNADESRVKVVKRTDYYATNYSSYTQGYYTTFSGEAKLASALLYVTSSDTPVVYFLSGHGEPDSASYITLLTAQLEQENYDVKTLNLGTDDTKLESGDTLIVVSPEKDLSEAEYATLKTWLADGGRLLMAMFYSVDMTNMPNLTALLDYYHLGFDAGYVEEDASATSNWRDSTAYLIPTQNSESSIMAEMPGFMYLPNTRPLKAVEFPESGVEYTTLISSSDLSTVVTEAGKSEAGSRILGMTALDRHDTDSNKDIRIALLGSVYTIIDSSLLYQSYNLNFTMSLIDWLVNRQDTVSIRSKLVSSDALTIPDSTTSFTLGIVIMVAIPLIVLACGIWVWLRRRHL